MSSIEATIGAEFLSYFKQHKDYAVVADHLSDQTLTNIGEYFLDGLNTVDEPTFSIVAGSPGAGKSTFRRARFSRLTCVALRNDIDEVMAQIPEFVTAMDSSSNPDETFRTWYPSGAALAKGLMEYALEKRYDIIFDRACCTTETLDQIHEIKKANYNVVLYGLVASEKEVKRRVAERGTHNKLQAGVTVELALMCREGFAALWKHLIELADEATLYDSTAEERVVLATYDGKNSKVPDTRLFYEFATISDTLLSIKDFERAGLISKSKKNHRASDDRLAQGTGRSYRFDVLLLSLLRNTRTAIMCAMGVMAVGALASNFIRSEWSLRKARW